MSGRYMLRVRSPIYQLRLIVFLLAAFFITGISSQQASAATVTVCKQTVPSPDPSVTWFTFIGANTWSSGPNSYSALYPPNPFHLQSQQCHTFNTTGHDQYNSFAETVPVGWALTNISCTYTTSMIKILGANPAATFEPGDNTVTIDQNEPNVTCTFLNTRRGGGGGEKGSLSVTKTFVDATGLPIGPLNFSAQVNCTPNPVTPGNMTLTTPATATNSSSAAFLVSNIVLGDQCTLSETAPPIPPQAMKACERASGTATWDAPVYSPSATIHVTSQAAYAVNITNRLRCQKGTGRTGSLSVTKIVSPDPRHLGAGMTFNIQANCTGASHGYAFQVHGNTSAVPITVPLGTQCKFSEPSLPPLPPDCAWNAPQFSPSNATAGGIETVTNSYHCKRGTINGTPVNGSPVIGAPALCQGCGIWFFKHVTGVSVVDPAWAGTTFTFNVNCTDGTNTTTSPPYLFQYGTAPLWSWSYPAVPSPPVGTQCTITEPTLPPPFTDASGNRCTWHQQAPFTQTVTIRPWAQVSQLHINNYFTCRGRPPAAPPANCPEGTVFSNGECVKRQPQGPGEQSIPRSVVCLEGTVLSNGECVKLQPRGPDENSSPASARCPEGTVISNGECVKLPKPGMGFW